MMKIKSLAAGLVITTAMVMAAGPLQAASCFKSQPGWHMVSKHCAIKPASNWQQYKEGVYTQPATGKGLLPLL